MTRRRFYALVMVILLLGGCGVWVLDRVLDRQDRNRQAIRVSCLLLKEAIAQSGAGIGDDSEKARAQRDLTALYVGVVVRSMRPSELAKAKRLQTTIGRTNGVLTIPDCDDIALHPDRTEKRFREQKRAHE